MCYNIIYFWLNVVKTDAYFDANVLLDLYFLSNFQKNITQIKIMEYSSKSPDWYFPKLLKLHKNKRHLKSRREEREASNRKKSGGLDILVI